MVAPTGGTPSLGCLEDWSPMNKLTDNSARGLSRRQLLQVAGAAGVAIGSTGLFAACSPSGSPDQPSASGPPKPGGTLRVGVAGGTTGDVLDPHNAISEGVYPRTLNLFDLPGYRDPSTWAPEYRLVESAEQNSQGNQWIVRLREGVEFHDGKTLDADDLIFSINRILDPSAPTVSAGSLQFMGVKTLQKVDARTVRFVLERPFAPFVDTLFSPYLAIVPVDFDPANPVGTGPFKYRSFTPGQESVFEKFENYWGDGPYVDELVLTDLVDDSARVNALLGGQVEAIAGVPPSQIRVFDGRSDMAVLNSETGNMRMLTMRVDRPPFDDVRVRQALRLVAGRQQIIDGAYTGHGRVAADVFSPYDVAFDASLQRDQDLDQARSLLAEAGMEGLSVELVTSPVTAGIVEVAQIFAEQAREAGVEVTLRRVDPSDYYARDYANVDFSLDWWPTYPYLSTSAQASLPGTGFNVTHFDDPEYNEVFAKATAEFDEAKRIAYVKELQRIDFERGGNIVWGYVNMIDAYSNKVTGFTPDKSGWPLTSFAFKNVWFV